ncbi:lysophospholipid acyltransferase family protein [Amphritea balenae]|uniref:lysophospholipid acyltransferase family protein n=1 Tax=Amphritea balenae TaxID=452629 RepID=UPI001E4A57BC|nr:lysophospholipid acyltransferase family protein [Amphritea balenae]
MGDKEVSWSDFLAPKYWGLWLGIGLLRLVCALPLAAGYRIGRTLGRVLYRLMPSRRHVTQVNIATCFPELSQEEQQNRVKEVFENNGIGLIETGWAYWKDKDLFRSNTEFRNFELLDNYLKQGNGVILMGWHFSCLDLAGLLFSLHGAPCSTLYRAHNNPMLEWFFTSGRERFSQPIERKQTRQMLRAMRKNRCIWYAPDQDLGRKGTVFVPFFGQSAATTVATTKMHKLNQSPLVKLDCWRKPDNSGYVLEASAVQGFPSGEETEDASLINAAIEAGIRKAPSQYMWVHKRFKTQREKTTKFYKTEALFKK